MLLNPPSEAGLDPLIDRVHLADRVTDGLITEVIAQACPRALQVQDGPARIRCLIERQAWVEVTLTLLDLALPQWKLRRLIYDDGAWHCCLSRNRDLPIECDDGADGRHELLPLAILLALLEARARETISELPAPGVVDLMADVGQPYQQRLCCDNFA